MRKWTGDIYAPDLDIADMCFDRGDYGAARCHYYACLEETKKYNPGNIQRIEYIERKIRECDEHL